MVNNHIEPQYQTSIWEYGKRESQVHQATIRLQPTISYQTSIVSTLPYDIYIGYRNGAKFFIRAGGDQTVNLPPGLYLMTKTVYNDYYAKPVHREYGDSFNRASLREAFEEARDFKAQYNNSGPTTTFQTIYLTPKDVQLQGVQYLYQQDIVITRDHPDTWYHPYSEEGYYYRMIQQEIDMRKEQLQVHFEIVTEGKDLNVPRYINVCNSIYSVPCNSDPNRQNGLYVTCNNQVAGNGSIQPPQQFRYDLNDDSNPFKVFTTIKDAETLGDVAMQRKLELEDLEHKAKQMKHQNAIDEEERQRKKKEWEEEYARMKREMEHRQEELKMARETRALERKETSDILKWIPTIITGILSLVTIIMKVQAPAK